MIQKKRRKATFHDSPSSRTRSPGPEGAAPEGAGRSGRKDRFIRERLLGWYRQNARDLPWRRTRDPYAVWVSEIMLQQTRVETVIPYYRRFLEKFPDASSLAAASSDEVLKVWENLGYYSRARNLHEAAKIVTARHGGRLPEAPDDLARLPGVGEYTAGAVGSIAFGQPVAAVDGNVRRVLSRLYAIPGIGASTPEKAALRELAERLLPRDDPGGFNQALMDLGSRVCTPANPLCPVCPVAGECEACRQGAQDRFPQAPARKVLPRETAAAAVVRNRERRFLVVRRPPGGFLGGLWMFPGGILRPGEDAASGLRRAVRAQTGLPVRVLGELDHVETVYSHFRLRLWAFHCRLRSNRETLPVGRPERRWASREEMSALAFSKADRLLFPSLP